MRNFTNKNFINALAAAARAFFIAMAVICVISQAYAESIILDEQFTDNRNAWPLGDNKISWVAIQGGKLLMAGRSQGQGYAVINYIAPLKGLSAYTIETSIAKLSGTPEA